MRLKRGLYHLLIITVVMASLDNCALANGVPLKRTLYLGKLHYALHGMIWGKNKIKIEVSENCIPDDRAASCMALLAVSTIEKIAVARTVMKSAPGGRNPGAVFCKEQLEGAVVIASDLDGNADSLCSFSDSTFVTNSSLVKVYYKSVP